MNRKWRVLLALVAPLVAAVPSATASPPPAHPAVRGLDPKAALAEKPDCGAVRLMAPTAVPVSPGTCRGVRPGAWVRTSQGRCTFNFVFQGSDQRTYIGTAGHCIFKDGDGERTWSPGEGPGAWDVDENYVGEFAYALLGGGTDFALIRAAEGVPVNPAMCHWGGPTGLYDEMMSSTSPPMTVRHYGGGVGLGDTIPARTGVLTPNGEYYYGVYWYGAVLWGDSGSGLLSEDGRALAVNVSISPWIEGNNFSTRIDYQLPLAEAALGIDLELMTAPLEAVK